MSYPTHAMILAAGRGERMRPLSDQLPKPLLAVAGKPLIVWQIERLAAAGIHNIVINHAHLGAQIVAALGDGSRFGVHIQYSAEAQALETAGGIAQALPLLGGATAAPFLVVSADIYCACDYRHLLERVTLHERSLACLWLVDNPAWHERGDFALRDGWVHQEGEPRLTYANIGLFRPGMFAGVAPAEKLPLRPLFDAYIPAGRIQGAYLQAPWDNLGTPEQLAALNAQLAGQA